MSRGLFFFVMQIIASVGVTATGLWALFKPRHLQQFVRENFALLPEATQAARFTRLCLGLVGLFALWYGATLMVAVRQELLALRL
jgi:hypothetical protein